MDVHAELARFKLDPALANGITETVQTLIDQARDQTAQAVAEARRLTEQITRRDTELHAAQIKIQALTLELAHLRRMRFGASSEAFSPEGRDLFQETLASDLAAAQAELAKAEAYWTSGTPSSAFARWPSAVAGSSAAHRAPA